MTFRSLLRICGFAAAVSTFSLSAPAADTQPAPAPAAAADESGRDYVRYQGDNIRGKLETVVVTLKNAAGIKVDLIGAVHIADAAYYATLMRLFTGYEALLFELVDGQNLRKGLEAIPKPGRAASVPPRKGLPGSPSNYKEPETDEGHGNPAFGVLKLMMTGLGTYLRLQYQTDGIDYLTKNFVHADVSMAEFARLQEEKGESFMKLFQKAFEAQIGRVPKKDEEPTGGQLLLALLGDSSGIKITMARMLGKAETLSEELGIGQGSVIVGERNRVALEIFDREVKAGKKHLGIFYGAAHLPDMENRLEQRGFKRTGELWVTAWDIKPRKEEKAATPAKP